MTLQIQIDKMRKFTAGKLRGSCAAILADGRITINNITIVEGTKGLFVSMPQRKGKDGDGNEKYYNVVSIRDDEDLKAIKDAAMAAFEGGEKAREPIEAAAPPDEVDMDDFGDK